MPPPKKNGGKWAGNCWQAQISGQGFMFHFTASTFLVPGSGPGQAQFLPGNLHGGVSSLFYCQLSELDPRGSLSDAFFSAETTVSPWTASLATALFI